MTQFNLTLLGAFRLAVGREAVNHFRSDKVRALLAYLAFEPGQAHSRRMLLGLLWPEIADQHALNNLRVTLHRLRQTLNAAVPDSSERLLTITRHTIQLNTAEVEIDVNRFQQRLAATSTHQHPNLAACPDCLVQLAEAAELYRGELLSGFGLADAPAFEEWLLLRREMLHQQALMVFTRLAETYEIQKKYDQALAYATRLVDLDPYREESHRILMRLLTRNGQPDQALAHYGRWHEQLRQEMGVAPAEETVALVEEIRSGQLSETASSLPKQNSTPLSRSQASPEPPPLDVPLSGLSQSAVVDAPLERPAPDQLAEVGELPSQAIVPYPRNHNFTGRRESLLQLAMLLLPDEEQTRPQAVAITGMGGLGKTQLAVEFIFRYGRYYPGGVYWLSFADPHSVADEIAATGNKRGMGLYRETDGLTLTDQIGRVQRAWQEPVSRLLIFDNCESEELFAKWRPVTGGCRVLVTSRRGYWDQGLGISLLSLTVLDRLESIEVLQQIAPRLPQAEAEAIAAEVDDYPLALHLAGNFLQRYQHVSTAAYLAQLRDQGLLEHPSLQGHGISYSPTGHELHVIRTFAMNAEQLNSPQAVDQMALPVLAAVTCFAPGEPLPQTILHGVFDRENDFLTSLQVQDGIMRLASLGLLHVKGHEVVVLHRLVAAYVEGTLIAPDLLAEVCTAVENSLIALLTNQNTGLYGLTTLPLASVHLNHMIEKARQRVDKRGIQLLLLRGCHQRDRGSYEAAERSFQSALHLQAQSDELNDLERMALLDHLGNLYVRMGRYRKAQSCFENYLTIVEQAPEASPIQLARGINQQGQIYTSLGKFELAQEYLDRSVALYREHLGPGQPSYEYYLTNLALLHLWKGDYQTALQLMERNLQAVKDTLGLEHLETAMTLTALGESLFYLGRIEEALAAYKQALKIQQKRVGLKNFQTAYTLTGLGRVWLARGQLTDARQYLADALAIREQVLGARHKYTAQNLNLLGELHLKLGDYDTAKTYLDRALDIRQTELGDEHPDMAESLIILGEWYLVAQKDEERAKKLFEAARRILAGQVAATHVAFQRVQRNLAMMEDEP